ncbi:MAG: PAS domain S-box protein [Methylovulum sp.]|nr:PAS domain S-box protein [Methylovulum sp.]
MPTQSPNEKALLAENAELRARLEEAEETLRAFRSGEVDALVMESPTGPQVYSQQSADAESNRFCGDILTQITDVVIAIDLEQRITYFNAAAERQYCIRARDVLGSKIDKVYTRHWPSAEAEAVVWSSLRERGEWQGEAIHRTFDGRELYIEASISALRGHDGKTNGQLAVLRDITERKHNEKLLEENQQRFAEIIKSAMDAVITVDQNHTVLVFNPAAEKMFGCSADEAIGGSLEQFIPEKFRHAHDVHIRAFGRTSNTSRKMGSVGRVIGLRAKGEEFPIEVSISQSGTEGAKLFTAILRDISERVHVESILKEQLRLQDQLTKIAASVPGLICSFRLDQDGSASMPYASPSIESFYGVTHEAVADDFSPVFARIHPDDVSQINKTITDSARNLQPWRDTWRYNHPWKGELWLEGHSMPQREPDGSIIWHGYIQDITHRKLAETTLQERENELRLIMDATPALISYLDTDFRYLRVNKTYENWLCLHQEQILGHAAREILGEKAWAIVSPYLERARSGERVSFDCQILYGTGKPRWVHGNYIPDKDVNGNVKGVVVHVTDIDDRKKTELALEESERQNRFLADTLDQADQPFGIGYPDGRMEYVNHAFEVLTGFSRDELLAMDWATELTPPEWKALEQAKLEELQHNQRAIRYEKEYYRKDGTRVPIELFVDVTSDEAGLPLSYYAFITDLTERKQAEAALRESEERMRLATETTGVGIWEWNVISNQMRWDAQMFRIYGIDPSQDNFVGYSTWSNAVLPEDLPHQEAVLQDTAKRGGHSAREFRILRANNKEIRYIQAVETVRKNSQGQIEWVVGTNFDITDLRHATQALQASEARLALGVQVAGLAIAEVDYNSGLNYLSAEAAQLFGLGDAEMVLPREAVHATLHPDDRAELLRLIEECLAPSAGNGWFDMDHRVMLPNGAVRWLHVCKQVTYSGEGEARRPLHAILAIHDVTIEKQAAELVLASETFVRSVLNSLPEHVVVLDANGEVTAVNEPWERFASENDASPHAVSTGANYLEVCRRSSAAGDPYAHQALIGLEDLFANRRQEFVMEYPCPSLSLNRWFLMHAKRANQSIDGIVISHVDITEHKHTEEQLLETQARLALVIAEVKAGYWDWNLLTNALYLSSEWQRQLGLGDKDSLIQWDQKADRLHPDDKALVVEASKNFIEGRLPVYELEFRLRHKDGSYRWIHSRGALLRDPNNRPYRMLGINLDITDYKKAKELNDQRDKMEQSFRFYVASQTVAAIAHELNQPLAAISSYADVALEILQSGNKKPEKLAHILENCALQAQRAGDVIRQLLGILQKGEFQSEPIDIDHSVQEARDFVIVDTHFQAFTIVLDLAANLPPVMAHPLQIQKVLINLLRNGLESMQESSLTTGIISVTTHRSAADPAKVQVTVCDTGKGVAETAELKKMFQHFYTTKTTGLGMGLAISRALVEAHGGKMWAEQNQGPGISVHFSLPFVP